MRVLCAQRDGIGKIGGGESASTRLFQRVTDAVFTWPVSQTLSAGLPPNFDQAVMDPAFRSAVIEELRPVEGVLDRRDCEDFYEALSIAHAVRGREFDVVECPDYASYGRFLPFALSEYGTRYKRLVCSLHGRVSRTQEIENAFNEVFRGDELEQLRLAERQSIFGADIRYGFSDRYARQTASEGSLPVRLVDALCALPPARVPVDDAAKDQHVWFVGRQDRIKGMDLFLRAVFRAGPELWERYAMCGPAIRLANRSSLADGLAFCRNRGMPFHYRGAVPYHDVVREVFQAGALVVIPSREDTFNLVALEALLNGVPVLISKHAGAADFIHSRFGSGFAGASIFDPLDEIAAAAAMRSMWQQLEEHRRSVKRALGETDLTPKPDCLMEVYASEPRFDPDLRKDAFRAWDEVRRKVLVRQEASNATRSVTSHTTPAYGKKLFDLADEILSESPRKNPSVSLDRAHHVAGLSHHTNRARIYRYLAQCEEASRPAVAAAYRLRAFRMGALSPAEESTLAANLDRLGFHEEEKCLRQWSNPESVGAYLEDRKQQLLHVKLDAPEYVIDHRDADTPLVSIIVSMYSATKPVLDHFVAQLSAVSMVRNRRAEIVFVDGGSPEHQKELLESISKLQEISHVMIRSVECETIQTAWNRGIQLSRGHYITCLGVDEGLTEFALDDLARFLDENPDVDWVTANTVVTDVDANGHWKRDVMTYNRTPYGRFRYLNDCTYINYVGGLYRRSIHNRFGWYDGTFKGAGDTEFKCRIFPFIRTAALPKTLGFYFNFPAERVTSSAHVEIEDLRAWYVFRTPGGIEYLMRGQDTAAWEEMFWTALSGRRSWLSSTECDLSFALTVLTGLLRQKPSHPLRALAGKLRALLREMHLLQDWSGRRAWLGAIAELDLIERSRSFFKKCANARPDLNFPLDFRSDALFFAHSWMWQK